MRWLPGLLLAGCFGPKTTVCPETHAICPDNTVCADPALAAGGTYCVGVGATGCDGLADNDPCTLPSNDTGYCSGGGCQACSADLAQCHYPDWQPMKSPSAVPLHAVWFAGPKHAFAVGADDTVLEWNGAVWTVNASLGTNDLIAIWGTDATNVYALGNSHDLRHYDGATWTTDPMMFSPNQLTLAGVSASELYIAGLYQSVWRYDGTAWTLETGGTPGPTPTLHGAFGLGTDVALAVGSGVGGLHSSAGWSFQSFDVNDALVAVWGVAADDAFAVGNDKTNAGLILHRSTAGWGEPVQVGTLPLVAVWGRAHGDVFAVGRSGAIAHYDGATWTEVTVGVETLEGVAGTPDDVFAVGNHGTILRYSPPR